MIDGPLSIASTNSLNRHHPGAIHLCSTYMCACLCLQLSHLNRLLCVWYLGEGELPVGGGLISSLVVVPSCTTWHPAQQRSSVPCLLCACACACLLTLGGSLACVVGVEGSMGLDTVVGPLPVAAEERGPVPVRLPPATAPTAPTDVTALTAGVDTGPLPGPRLPA